jgi:hypothetical protein
MESDRTRKTHAKAATDAALSQSRKTQKVQVLQATSKEKIVGGR